MKNILVTGASGFIGKYVVRELLQQGHRVVAATRNIDTFCHSYVSAVPFNLERLDDNLNYFEYFGRPDICIHLAWEGLPNYKAAFHEEENLPRHKKFLDNLISGGLQHLTVTGTCLEYGLIEGELSEDMECNPIVSYARAKYMLSKWLLNLAGEPGVQAKWLRLFYMWGDGQSPNSLIPQLDAAIKRGDKSFPMSGGEQVRDFLTANEMAKRIVTLALNPAAIGIINCCSGKPVRVKDFVEQYIREKEATIQLKLGVYPYPDYEPMRFWGNIEKMLPLLKYK